MEEGQGMNQSVESTDKTEGYTKSFKSSKRTYFFDVQKNKWNDVYITITECKRQQKDGQSFNKRFKIFLYENDFDRFSKNLESAIKRAQSYALEDSSDDHIESEKQDYKDISFDDLEGVEITSENNTGEDSDQVN